MLVGVPTSDSKAESGFERVSGGLSRSFFLVVMVNGRQLGHGTGMIQCYIEESRTYRVPLTEIVFHPHGTSSHQQPLNTNTSRSHTHGVQA